MTRILLRDLNPDTQYYAQFRANQEGRTSAWSRLFPLQTNVDTAPPPKPSKPTLTSRLGTVTVTWDGLNASGQAMPSDFKWVEIHRSTSANFSADPTTVVGNITQQTLEVFADQAYKTTYYYCLVAVDYNKNHGPQSDVVGIETKPLVDTDLIGKMLSGAHFLDGTVNTASLADGSVDPMKLALGTAVQFNNKVANPSFESLNENNFPVSWNGQGRVFTDGGTFKMGSKAVSMTADTGAESSIRSDPFVVQGGESYYFQTNVFSHSNVGRGIYIRFLTSSNPAWLVQSSSDTNLVYTQSLWENNGLGYGSWALPNGVFTVPANHTYGMVWIYNSNPDANTTITIDSVEVSPVVVSRRVAAEAIGAREIAANSIVAGKIAADAVTAREIMALSISSGEIMANAITADKIEVGAVIASKISSSAVDASKISVGAIDPSRQAMGSGNLIANPTTSNLEMQQRFPAPPPFRYMPTGTGYGTGKSGAGFIMLESQPAGAYPEMTIGPRLPVIPGDKFYISFWVRRWNGASGYQVAYNFWGYDKNGVQNNYDIPGGRISVDQLPNNTYVKWEANFTVPGGVFYIEPHVKGLFNSNGFEVTHFSDFELRRVMASDSGTGKIELSPIGLTCWDGYGEETVRIRNNGDAMFRGRLEASILEGRTLTTDIKGRPRVELRGGVDSANIVFYSGQAEENAAPNGYLLAGSITSKYDPSGRPNGISEMKITGPRYQGRVNGGPPQIYLTTTSTADTQITVNSPSPNGQIQLRIGEDAWTFNRGFATLYNLVIKDHGQRGGPPMIAPNNQSVYNSGIQFVNDEIRIANNSGTAYKPIRASSFIVAYQGQVIEGWDGGDHTIMMSEPGVSYSNIRAKLYTNASSMKYKKNISPTTLVGLDIINRLDVVNYEYKVSMNIADGVQTGLIAENTFLVYPEAVALDGNGEPDAIDYSRFVPVLIKSIQELEAQIEELKGKVKSDDNTTAAE